MRRKARFSARNEIASQSACLHIQRSTPIWHHKRRPQQQQLYSGGETAAAAAAAASSGDFFGRVKSSRLQPASLPRSLTRSSGDSERRKTGGRRRRGRRRECGELLPQGSRRQRRHCCKDRRRAPRYYILLYGICTLFWEIRVIGAARPPPSSLISPSAPCTYYYIHHISTHRVTAHARSDATPQSCTY